MIAPPVLGNQDNMNVLLSNFDLPPGAAPPNVGDYVQVELYTPPSEVPLYKALGGSNEPDGKVLTTQDAIQAGTVAASMKPGSRATFRSREGS